MPGVHDAVAVALYSMLRKVTSPAALATHVPSAGKENAAGAVQVAFVKAATVGFEQVVATAHALQLPHDSVAPDSTVVALTNGVAAGQGTTPGATMHAEKPAGAVPPQTASALDEGTSQKRCEGSESSAGFGCSCAAHVPPAPGPALAVAWYESKAAWEAAGTATHPGPLTVGENQLVEQVSTP